MLSFLPLLLLSSTSTLVNGQVAPPVVPAVVPSNARVGSYSCDPASCKPPLCVCASTKPPGGLDSKKIPQFITLTFDDSVNTPLWPVIQNITSRPQRNPNGCPMSTTFFVSIQYTDYWYVQQLYSQGHEIATHTMTHVGLPNATQIVGAHQALNTFAGIPKSKLVGFRTPFLNYSTDTLRNLSEAGVFLYDSSMPYDPVGAGFWPYTLDNGVPATCASGTCTGTVRFPGLWEIPMYTLLNKDNSQNSPMDPNPLPGKPGLPTEDDMLELYKSNFLRNYNGDRLPLGIYLHAAQGLVNADRLSSLMKFIEWVYKEYPDDVYFINNQQLLSWMINPTDIDTSRGSPTLGCWLPAQESSNTEVCDGLDNKGSGVIDGGLVNNCAFPQVNNGTYFSTCFGCPSRVPSLSEPTPSRPEAKNLVPDEGCPNGGVWSPSTGSCVAMKRGNLKAEEIPPTPAANLPTPAGPGRYNPGVSPSIPPPKPRSGASPSGKSTNAGYSSQKFSWEWIGSLGFASIAALLFA